MPDGISLSPYNTRRQHEHADAMAQGHIRKEYEAWAAKVATSFRRAAQAIATGAAETGETGRMPSILEYLEDGFLELHGPRWNDIRRRYDDAGGDPDRMPFPSIEQMQA